MDTDNNQSHLNPTTQQTLAVLAITGKCSRVRMKQRDTASLCFGETGKHSRHILALREDLAGEGVSLQKGEGVFSNLKDKNLALLLKYGPK